MKKVSLILSTALMTSMMITGCGGSSYEEVKIGNQVWMAENLNVDEFRNGDPIPHANTISKWRKAGQEGQPAWCYYNNNPENGGKYGKLYNWYAVSDLRGLAPKGWHVPSDEEWSQLTDYLGGEDVAGSKMKSTNGWNENGNGTNESGFNGLPSGRRDGNSNFYSISEAGYWWSSEVYYTSALYRGLYYANDNIDRGGVNKGSGFSVRCLKD